MQEGDKRGQERQEGSHEKMQEGSKRGQEGNKVDAGR